MKPTSRLALLGIAVAAAVGAPRPSAIAGEERRLSMLNVNTGEAISVVYSRNGKVDRSAAYRIDWFLRDWRKDSSTRMDPRLLDLVWDIHRRSGSREPIHVHSGYRSPATNRMLRNGSRGVSRHSLHMSGKALDFHLPDVPVSRLRAIAMRMQDGGVGFYPSAGIPFVHVDVGSVRHWPRMSRRELARLFPDGGTAHVPSDGIPLENRALASAAPRTMGGTRDGGLPNPLAALAAAFSPERPADAFPVRKGAAPLPSVAPGASAPASPLRPPLDIPHPTGAARQGGEERARTPKPKAGPVRAARLAAVPPRPRPASPVPRPTASERPSPGGAHPRDADAGIYSADLWNAAELWPPSAQARMVDFAPAVEVPQALIPGRAVGPPLSPTEPPRG